MFIKHKMFVDVCIEVQSVQQDAGSLTIHGCFWNLGQVNSFCIGEPIKLTIFRDKIADWQQLTDVKDEKALRGANWQPLEIISQR